MIRILVAALAAACLFISGCGQEQPPVPPAPKAEAKPAVEPAAPAPQPAPAPAVTPGAPPVPAPQEPAKPAPPEASVPAKPAEPAKPAPAPAPAPAPVTPAAEAKPAPAPAAPKPIDVVDTVILEASQGKVTLPHLVHARLFPCATCHGDGIPGKIGLTKDTAHALCRDCHKAKGAGPTACGGCHKK